MWHMFTLMFTLSHIFLNACAPYLNAWRTSSREIQTILASASSRCTRVGVRSLEIHTASSGRSLMQGLAP